MNRNRFPWLLGIAALAVAACASSAIAGKTITGAGATFPYPIYGKWAYAYHRLTGVRLNYQAIGSGGGIKQIEARTVDFGASDAPMSPQELQRFGLVQFPMIMGGVCPVVKIKGVPSGRLRLSGPVLAGIFLGKIRKWNAPAITALNPGLNLPGRRITVVHRADGSGTTWIFTNYLCKVSPAWKRSVGNAKSVRWPTGVGGKGNAGVAAFVQRIPGSIGYVEYAYALQNKMVTVQLQNRSGKFVQPTAASFQAAAANADWAHAKNYYMVLTDQPGAASWPITGASFILMYKKQTRPDTAREILRFWDWCYRHGSEMALKLYYVPMPGPVVEMVEKMWARSIRATDGTALWPAH